MDSSSLFFDQSAPRGNMLFLRSNNTLFQGPRTMISMEENQMRKRFFFTSPDDLMYDEEYFIEEQLPEKKRTLTSEQVNMLEKSFEAENKLEPERKTELANRLGLQPRQVAVWFQNRRARSKSKQLERDYDILKASYVALRLDYESLLMDTDKLKSQKQSLIEKLQAKMRCGPGGPTFSPIQELPLDEPNNEAQQQNIKTEDRLSSGSSGVENPHLVVDSTGDSYFDCIPPHPLPPHCTPAAHPEDDDIRNDGRRGYFPSMFAGTEAAGRPEEEEKENGGQDVGWWVWS